MVSEIFQKPKSISNPLPLHFSMLLRLGHTYEQNGEMVKYLGD